MTLLTTKQVAEELGITAKRVLQLIWEERLPAQKAGRDYFINSADLKLVKNRKPGRPRKQKKKPAAKKR